MSRSATWISAQLAVLMVLLAALATAAPALSDDSEVRPAEPKRAGAPAASELGGAQSQPSAGEAPTSASMVAAAHVDGDGESSEQKLYNILTDLTGRHRVKRPSIMGLDNYDEATTTLELIRQRHRQRSRNQKPPPSPEVIRRILRILAMGKK